MAGNSRRLGAVRKPTGRKIVGTGGKNRRSLEGRGPTPKAEDREYHAAHRRKKAAERRAPSRTSMRKKDSGEVVAGRNSVVEALRAEIPATALYVMARIDSDDRIKEAIALAAERGLQMFEAGRTDLDRLTDDATHQGIALAIPPYEYKDIDDLLDAAHLADTPLLAVALDGITDSRNLGAIVRSTAGFGGHGVIVPERRAASMTAGAWKTSAGAAARIPVARVTNLVNALKQLRQAGVFVIGLDSDGDVELPDLAHSLDPIVFVAGAEGKGLGRLVRETCDVIVSIPMSAATESLNAGVAAGVALYEVARARRG